MKGVSFLGIFWKNQGTYALQIFHMFENTPVFIVY